MTNPYRPPVESDLDDVFGARGRLPMLRELLILQCSSVAALSILVGSLICIHFARGLTRFGGVEYVAPVLVLSIVRLVGSTTTTAACIFGLLVGTRKAGSSDVLSFLKRTAALQLLVVVLTTPVAIVLAIGAGFVVAHFAYGVPWTPLVASFDVVTLTGDALPATLILLGTFALNGMFIGFALPEMARRSWSLSWRIITALLVLATVHTSLDLASAVGGASP